MTAFEVSVNGQKLCTAGIDSDGATTIMMSWARRRGVQTRSHLPDSAEEELAMHVGGIESSSKEHLRWSDLVLQPGDIIEVKVVETDVVDQPKERRPVANTSNPGA